MEDLEVKTLALPLDFERDGFEELLAIITRPLVLILKPRRGNYRRLLVELIS